MEAYYRTLYFVVLICLGIGLLLSLIRAICGPRIADRIIGVNIIGTLGAFIIVLLALLLGEGYIMDVSLIYCLISFLSVVVLARIYISSSPARLRVEEAKKHLKEDEANG